MLCLKCKSDTKVYDTRLDPTNRVKRRRICTNGECLERFTTYERPREVKHPRGAYVKQKMKELRKIADKVEEVVG